MNSIALLIAGFVFRTSLQIRLLPDALNVMPGRREAKRRTGKVDVPVLILDDDTTVAGTKQIVAWAKANQAGAPSPKPAA